MRSCIALAVAFISLAAQGETIVKSPRGELIDAQMQRLEADGFGGALLVSVGGEVVVKKGYGLADREAGVPVATDTVFTIGSITKQFTGAGIMKLVEEGELKVTDRITKFFDGVPRDKRKITVHHLLTHTAGLRDGFGNDEDPMERDELMRLILESPLKRPIGQRYMYTNAGYSMLGAIIEKVSGMGYEAYLRDRFFDPLGMDDTGYVLPRFDKSRLAVGYAGNGRRWGTLLDYPWADDGPYWNLRCNGGILSTLDDMYAWHRALETDAVLTQESRDLMFTPHVSEGPNIDTFYGYGWVSATTVQGTKLITHNGGNGFFFADMYRYIDEGVCFILFTNCGDTMGSTLDLRHMARGLRTELPD